MIHHMRIDERLRNATLPQPQHKNMHTLASVRRSYRQAIKTAKRVTGKAWNRGYTYTTLLNWHGVQEIYCASVSNIASAVAGTKNVLGSEAFILWLPGLQ